MINKNNPYTLVFGKKPAQNIPRLVELNEVLDTFLNEPPNQQIFMITGIRGCGKTVFMTEAASILKKRNEWEVLELSTSQIQDIVSPQIAIRETLDAMKKHDKKLLICIDEVVSNDYMREFASIFQILLREDFPIYLLMTGLYENINDLRNEKNLTFLYRAPEIRMQALNLGSISENYKKNLGVSAETAKIMANMTKGYSFAFQVLGYFTFRHGGVYEDAISEYRQYLEDYVYEKLWSELSRKDKKLLYAIASSESGKAKEIKDSLKLRNNQYTPYRDRLIKKMLVNGDEYGYLKISLPLFEDFIKRAYLAD